MNRKYSSDVVVNACKKLREAKDNPFIACDLITGFPGETDKAAENTKNFLSLKTWPGKVQNLKTCLKPFLQSANIQKERKNFSATKMNLPSR